MKIIKTSQQVIDALDFQMMPEDGGQMIEVTYACDEYGLWCRSHDRSDSTTRYEYAAYPARITEEQMRFEPWNSRLPRHNQWRDVIVG